MHINWMLPEQPVHLHDLPLSTCLTLDTRIDTILAAYEPQPITYQQPPHTTLETPGATRSRRYYVNGILAADICIRHPPTKNYSISVLLYFKNNDAQTILELCKQT